MAFTLRPQRFLWPLKCICNPCIHYSLSAHMLAILVFSGATGRYGEAVPTLSLAAFKAYQDI